METLTEADNKEKKTVEKKRRSELRAIDLAKKVESRAEKFIERLAENVQEAGMYVRKIVEILTSEDRQMYMEEDEASKLQPSFRLKNGKDRREPEIGEGKSTRERQQTNFIFYSFRNNVAFFNVRLVVPPSHNTIDEDIEICQTILNILQDSDVQAIPTQIKGEYNPEAILKPSDILPVINKLRQLFDCIFPNDKGGNINPGIRISNSVDWATSIENGYYALSKKTSKSILNPSNTERNKRGYI